VGGTGFDRTPKERVVFRGGFVGQVFSLEKSELRKFFTMSAMMFCIVYIFTMTR
jgi:ATP/ADP translocase